MRTLNEYFLTGLVPTLAANSELLIPVPDAGKIVEIRTALYGAIANTDAIITCYINAVAVTGGAVTIAFTGSAEGDIDTVYPTAANSVKIGDYIRAYVSTTTTNAITAGILIVIRR
jgi:hypothetical protein